MSEYPNDDSVTIAAPDNSVTDEPSRRRRRLPWIAGASAVSVGLALGGWGMVSAAASSPATAGFPDVQSLRATSTIDAATVAESVDAFVVDITAYDGETGDEDAGTGMVVTANGEVLTNNHVVSGATRLAVKVVSSGRTYQATVLGTDATDDVALIKLRSASGLTTLTAADPTSVGRGTAVAAIGNAMNKPGKPSVATGTITATGRSITASDEVGGTSERLTALLQTDADVVSGDSGGPLVDSSGQVIGMDTAASSSGTDTYGFSQWAGSQSSTGFAIPITRALDIAKKIASGDGGTTIVIGTPGLLGVEVASAGTSSSMGTGGYGGFGDEPQGFGGAGGFGEGGSTGSSSSTTGATVEGVIQHSAAAAAGLAAGDVITAVSGHPIRSASALSTRLGATSSGDTVSITWTDTSGTTHTATVTLGRGPAA